MKQQRDSKQRIALVQRFAEGPAAPEEIQVVPTGKWDHPAYGEMEITSADIARFVENFKAKVRLDLPITAGHDNGMSGGELNAIGWFTELIDRGVNGLWGAVKWTEEGKNLLIEGAFKYFSPEFYEQYSDPETGAKYEHVLVGGALTNKPYFKELEPVMAFSEPDIMNQITDLSMNLKDILAKKPKELSEPEKAFLKAHKSELSAEQLKTFDEVVAEESAEDKASREAKEAEEKAAAEKAAADQAAADAAAKAEAERLASERGKVITMSEAEAKALREKADQGAKAFAELETMRAEKTAEKHILSESNKEGRFLPKQKPALATFMRSLSETQRDQFQTLISGMPRASLSFKELGDGGKQENDVVSEVDTAVKAKMTELKLSYSDALKKVFAEDKKLAQRYNDHMSGQEE
jgi:phage I-like protein